MRRLDLVLIGLTIVILSNGQTIKIQGGTSISRLDYLINASGVSGTISVYNKNLIGYSFFTGIDYLDKQYFNLSSNIGMIRKGGKDEFQVFDDYYNLTGQTTISKPTLDYLSINTLFDLKYCIKEIVTPFISMGPRLDYLVKYSEHFDDLEELDELKSISFGLLFGGGLKYDINNFQLGIRADYYFNFTKIANWITEFTSKEVTVSTISINLTIGYRVK